MTAFKDSDVLTVRISVDDAETAGEFATRPTDY